ncbi:MAG: sodium/proline symporter PutP [Gammaproteobacteria bacterium]|nr:sodium/proline symporter PutP [Gammaproteobacteria bacterium]
MAPATAAAFIAYFVVIAGIGYASLKRTHGLDDYAIGGRSLKAPVAALSAGASDMSGWLLLGLPGAVYALGLSQSWIVIGLVAGAWCNWKWVAPRLRHASAALDGARSLPQLFARRMGGDRRALTVVATLVVLGFFTLYTAAGFVAGAKLFSTTLGLDYATALWLGVAAIMLYTAVGGFLAVSWTDFFQALLMMGALTVVAVLAFAELPAERADIAIGAIAPVGAVSLAAWGLGYFGQPHVLARFMAIESVAAVPRARRICMSWMVVSSAGALAVGVLGAPYFAATGTGLADPETVFIALCQALLHPAVAGFAVAAILAAVMSTVDSQLLVTATALVDDLPRIWKRVPSERQLLVASRLTVVAVAAAAGTVATDPDSQVLGLVAYAWAGLGASFGPALLFTLFWRRTSANGLIAGMVVGATTVVGWRGLEGGVFDLYELLPAFLAACLAIWVISLVESGDPASERAFDRSLASAG